MVSTLEVNDLFKYLGKIEELLAENEKLKKELASSESRVRDYRAKLKDIYDNKIPNYEGALKRRQDETHVLYHKISTLLPNRFKPEDYDKLSNERKREALQKILDERVPPAEIFFTKWINGKKYNEKQYTLQEYAVKPHEDPVEDWPTQPLTFC